jgi:hypothetical protein
MESPLVEILNPFDEIVLADKPLVTNPKGWQFLALEHAL